MKKTVLLSTVIAVAFVFSVNAQTKTEKFKVWGNCGMCEKTIEKAANSVEGVSSADWNKESKMMQVKFDSTKTNEHKVQMAIAQVGYDTEMHKADDEAYKKLPGCCQYDRKKDEKSKDKKEMHHDGDMH